MRRVQAGDAHAFASVYDRHVSGALLIARLVCETAQHADEAIQEGFLAVWRRRASYDRERGTLQGWVFAVIRSCSIDIYRRNRRHDSGHTRDVSLDLFAVDGIVDDHTQMDDARQSLRNSLRKLPVAEREAIGLAYFAGLSHVQIAERLGVPPGTVKRRIRLGLSRAAGESNQATGTRGFAA